MFMDESDFVDQEPSAKDAEDLLHEVEELVLSEAKDEPKKKSKKKKSSKSKSRNIPPPEMAPPPAAKSEHEEEDFPEVERVFQSSEPKREARRKEVDEAGAGLDDEQLQRHFATQRRMEMEEAALGPSLGTPSSQSRARVLQQQRELQMRRRQQSMMGGMMRATEVHHTPTVRQISAPRSSADGLVYSGYRAPPTGYPTGDYDRRPATASSTPHGRDQGYGYQQEGPSSVYDRTDPRFSSGRSPPRPTTGGYGTASMASPAYDRYDRGSALQAPPYGRAREPEYSGDIDGRDGPQGYGYPVDQRPLTYDEPQPRSYPSLEEGAGRGGYEEGRPSGRYSPPPQREQRRSPPRNESPYEERRRRDTPPRESVSREEADRLSPANARRGGGGGGHSDGYNRRNRTPSPSEGKDQDPYDVEDHEDPRDPGGSFSRRDDMSRSRRARGRRAEEPEEEEEEEERQAPSAIYSAPKSEGSLDSSNSERNEAPGVWDPATLDLQDANNMRDFLMSPAPREAGVVQCYIKRNKAGTKKMFPEYKVYMKVGDSDRDMFLMTGKKRSGQKTSNYLISMSEGDLRRTSDSYLGKLRANFVGTEFKVYDNGSNPEDEDEGGVSTRHELGVVQYESNVLGSRGPRRMQVGIPKVYEDGRAVAFQPMSSKESMLAKFKNREYRDIVVCINKPPRWNDQVGAFVLNFNGRVTMASVKNFQLITHEDQERVLLQFGRVAKDEFTMDFQWPFTPFQAFAVTLSSFDSKIACD